MSRAKIPIHMVQKALLHLTQHSKQPSQSSFIRKNVYS
uniref:Uncharacterized protein n=1 Tax=Anguilla anguilla TaxID=7936 RepID=A0A0E9UHW0_ANGAN